jgi:16S rRNA (guanine(966)-N(2))-methyltransferase RsmD
MFFDRETFMRVIAGSLRGRALRCGRGPVYRPTAQIVKGSLFDTLGGEIEDAVFLELFAGSGGVGIEALSRGALRAVFVEQDRRILKAVRANLQRCGIGADRAVVRNQDAMRFLDRLIANDEYYDIIFADPPYAGNLAQKIVERIDNAGGAVCGLLVIEHGEAVYLKEKTTLELVRSSKFGQTAVTYYKKNPE